MLTDCHYHADGRPVAIDGEHVIQIEPHESGAGTFVRIKFEGGSASLHLAEPYEDLRYFLDESPHARSRRLTAEEDGRPFDRSDPFGFKAAKAARGGAPYDPFANLDDVPF